MTTVALLVSITMYVPHTDVLYCGGLVSETMIPWIAMPVSDYGITWKCGDRIGIKIDGELYFFDALDAGPFAAYCVRQLDGTCPRIAADIPERHAPFPGLSAVGTWWNVEPIRREWGQHRD